MPNAILIGFEYKFNSLIGTKSDLKQCFDWCSSFNCIIDVFTDTSISLKHQIVNNAQELLIGIISKIKTINDSKLIIYYTGHGIKDSIVMPDKSLLSFIDFRDNILSNLEPYIEIFWILDCCNPSGLNLPYILDNNRFVLSSTKIQPITQPMLLITSSNNSEKSIATKNGSLFSKYLFEALTAMNNGSKPIIRKKKIIIPKCLNRNLRRLIDNISNKIRKMDTGYSQTVSIYSSYIIDPLLWMWIGSNKNYDIVSDMSLSTLIVR